MTDAELLKAMLENAFEQGHRVGFESAKAAATQLVLIERHIAEETGDECDLSQLEERIEKLQPEVTR